MTTIAPVNVTVTTATAPPAAAPASSAARFGFGDDGFTFGDLLDIINPLQHIPIVGTIYRAITGDQMAPAAEIAGGALYGGPIGALFSVADVAFTAATGKPIDQTMLAWVGIGGHDDHPSASTAVAQTPANAVPPHPAMPAPIISNRPSRAFPAATSRIVPLAASYATPLPAPATAPAIAAATAAPAAIAPAQPEPAASPATPPPPPTTASASPQPDLQGAQALLAALRDSGVDPSSAARAAAAYQASLVMQSPIARVPATDTQH